MPRTLPSMAGVAKMISLGELATLIYLDQHHFEELVVCSNRNREVRKNNKGIITHYKCPQRRCQFTSDNAADRCDKHPHHDLKPVYELIPNPFWGQNIEKVYNCLVRNNYSYPNSVERELERNGYDSSNVEYQGRKWGSHVGGIKDNRVPRTPFIIHEHKSDGVKRLHGKFKPSDFLEMEGETGYYVDGVKIDDALIAPFVKKKKKPETPEEEAKQKSFPVNCRLENILYMKISGSWYRLKTPSIDEIEALALAAEQWGEQLIPA